MRRRYREWRHRRRQRQEDPGRAILPPHERQQGDRLSDQIEAMRLRNALRRRDPIEESEEDFDEGAEEGQFLTSEFFLRDSSALTKLT